MLAVTRIGLFTATMVVLLRAGVMADARSDELVKALSWKSSLVPQPIMAVGPCKTPPTIDGKFDPAEWADACAVSTLSDHEPDFAYTTALAYATYDADRFYFGYIRYKSTPTWFTARSRFRDSATYLDPHVELFLSPDPGAGKDLAYQFCINAYGTVYDILNVPAFGQTSPGYNPRIEFKTSETQRDWYIEGSVSVKDLDPQGRFTDGAMWRANFCWAWPEIAWCQRPVFWIVRDNMGYLRLDSSAPALQWLDAYPLQEGKLDIKVGIKNTSNSPGTYLLSAKVTGDDADQTLAADRQEITLAAGERRELRLAGDGDFAGRKAIATLECTSRDGKTIYYQQYLRVSGKLAGSLAVTVVAQKTILPLPKDIAISVRYGPISNAIEVQADVWNLVRGDSTLDRVHVWVERESLPGKVVASIDLNHFQKDLALWKYDLPKNTPPGKYLVKAQAFSKVGKVISEAKTEFTTIDLKDPLVNKPYQARPGRILDWIGTSCGVTKEVPPPWTPIKGNAKSGLSVLNRKVNIDGSGLPSQINAVGEDILAGPVRYVAVVDGKPLEMKPGKLDKFASDKAGMWTKWQGSAAAGPIKLTSKAKMEYDGLIGYELLLSCAKPVTLDSLYLDIPIKRDLATRINIPISHLEMPSGDGVVWESKSVVENELMNTLVSHVWVGNWKCGLAFVADQTKGWYEQAGKSLETISREQDAVHLRVYFVQGPQQVTSTSLNFSLLATPSRVRDAGWRNFPKNGDKSYFWIMDWLDSRDYDKVEGSIPRWNWDDPSKKHYDELLSEDRTNSPTLGLPYTNPWFHYPYVVPWVLSNASPVEPIVIDEWANMPSRWGFVRPVASERDYMTYNYDWYFRTKHYAGFYIDEAYGAEKEDINMINGSGWIDRNGNLRGSYHSMDVRELFKRQYVIGMQYSPLKKPFMMNHTSWGQSPQYMSHVNCSLLVENLPVGPGECYLDHMPLSTLQFWGGRMWGTFGALTGIGPDDKAQRYCLGELMLHDICLFADFEAMLPLRKDFGIGAEDVVFSGYWEEPKVAVSSDAGVVASIYKRPGSVLAVVCNVDTKSAHKASVRFDAKTLGLPSGFVAVDYETGKPVNVENSTVSVDLGARDVTYLHLTAK